MGPAAVVVGRIGRAHGIRGEVSVEPRTDEPDRRFAVGSRLRTVGPDGERPTRLGRPDALTVQAIRWHQGRLLVTFAELADRTAAEAVRGLLLEVSVDPAEAPEDPEEFYDHQLVGLVARTTTGDPVGEVRQVLHGAAQDLLVIDADGRELLVPFVSTLVPEVDLAAGVLVVDERTGILDAGAR